MTLKLVFRTTANLCTPWNTAMPRVLAFIKVLAGFCIRTRKAVAVISTSASWDAFMSVLVLNIRNNLSGEFHTLNYVVPSIHPSMHASINNTYIRTYIHTYSLFQKLLYREEKSNSALLQTVIRVETCSNVLKHVSVCVQEWRKELAHVPSQCSLELHCCRYVVVRCNNESLTNDTTARFPYNLGGKRIKTVRVCSKCLQKRFVILLCQPASNLQYNQRSQRHGSVYDLPRSGRPRTSLTEENLTTVAQALFQSPKKSIQKTSAEFIVPPTSVYRIVKVLTLKAYRPHLLQMLTEDDSDWRVEFSE
jgi:hypothetical protein